VGEARRILRRAADEDAEGPVLAAGAAVAAGVAGLLGADPRAVVETERAIAAAERLNLGWLARVGRAALTMAAAPAGAEYARSDATAVREAAAHDDDRWGEGLAALAEGWSALGEPEAAVEPFESAATRFRALGAGSLEAWARAMAAIAQVRAGSPDARDAALVAEAVARSAGMTVLQAVAHRALAETDLGAWAELGTAADGLLADAGLVLPPDPREPDPASGDEAVGRRPLPHAPTGDAAARPLPAPEASSAPPAELRLFGAFSLAVAGRPIDLGA